MYIKVSDEQLNSSCWIGIFDKGKSWAELVDLYINALKSSEQELTYEKLVSTYVDFKKNHNIMVMTETAVVGLISKNQKLSIIPEEKKNAEQTISTIRNFILYNGNIIKYSDNNILLLFSHNKNRRFLKLAKIVCEAFEKQFYKEIRQCEYDNKLKQKQKKLDTEMFLFKRKINPSSSEEDKLKDNL